MLKSGTSDWLDVPRLGLLSARQNDDVTEDERTTAGRFESSCHSPCPLMGHTVNMTYILPCMCIPRTTTTCAPPIALHFVRRAYSQFPPVRRRRLLQECRASPARKDTRTLAAATRQRYTDNELSSSYRQQDRESDEVDVCIVGGGESCLDTDLLQ